VCSSDLNTERKEGYLMVVKIAKVVLGAIMFICLLLLFTVSGEQEFSKALLGLVTITSIMLVSAFIYQFFALNEHKFNKKGSSK
jgi:glucan phosphoethanolaminetransferase (alkaline phosphatase superfamily)